MIKLKDRKKYKEYLSNCEMKGDTHRPFTFEEWLEQGKPK